MTEAKPSAKKQIKPEPDAAATEAEQRRQRLDELYRLAYAPPRFGR